MFNSTLSFAFITDLMRIQNGETNLLGNFMPHISNLELEHKISVSVMEEQEVPIINNFDQDYFRKQFSDWPNEMSGSLDNEQIYFTKSN